MGREVRMVPADWRHPKAYDVNRGKVCYVPLFDGAFGGGYEAMSAEWDEGWQKWQEGLCENYGGDTKWKPIDPERREMRFTDYAGARPSPDDYMPNWPDEQRTHYMMYEDTTEGTPISPAFATPHELARWLADNNASAFAGDTATYEQWLRMIEGPGSAMSMVISNGKLQSGVEFLGGE